MIDIKASGQDVPEKSDYHSAIKDQSNNIAGEFNTIVIKTLNNENYKPPTKKHGREESNLDNSIRWIIIIFSGFIMFSFLCYFGIPLLYTIINSLYTTESSYNAEVEFMININNDSIEETRYQHVFVDTPDIYIEEETYDHKIVPLNKESNLPGENAAFNNVQVSKI